MKLRFVLNGRPIEVETHPGRRLLDLLREDLGLIGVKEGCGEGECGACTVLVDGKPRLSCLTAAVQVEGKEILTIEGLRENGELHPIQRAFVEAAGVQCGFCTPGFIMSTYALLKDNPDPSDEEIMTALEGNLCRCTGYVKQVEAIELAVRRMEGKDV